jgi:internalin A
MMRTVASAVLVLLALAACDDPKKTAPAAPSASTAAPVAAPVSSASATAAETPKKKEPVKCEASPATVTFTMPGLEAEIRKKLAKPDGPITPAEIAKVKSVNLAGVPTSELDPCVFPMLKGVKDLFLGKGELTDLSPVASLTQLATFFATGNEVSDTSPLAKMTKMDRLDLSKTKIKDISVVASMPELTELSLDDTEVTDLTPVAKCTKLEKLSANHTKIKDVHALVGLKKLRNLWMEGAPVEDTKALAPLVSNGLKVKF